MNLPKEVLYIIDTLTKKGFEAYAVGGCVRDSLMGVEPKDYDITTNALPLEVKELFKKTVDTGIQHGTVTVVENGENFEVTTYRIDGEYLDNRRPESVVFTPNLKEDLLRRDFTINAIAYNPQGYQDFFLGQEHIKAKIIMAVGDPYKRFEEDSLRIYRGVRFACQLGFEIESGTKTAMIERAFLTKNLSVERIREELIKTLKSKHLENLETFIEVGVLNYYDTTLEKHFKENIVNIIENLKKVERTSTNVLSVLFFNLPISEIKKQLKQLKLDNKTIKEVETILEYIETENEDTAYFVRKMLSKYGEFYLEMLTLQEAIKNIDNSKIEEKAKGILQNKEPINIKDLAVNGGDMQGLGFTGVKIGETLNFLLDQVHQNPSLNTKEKLFSLIK